MEEIHLVTFRLGPEEYGIKINLVREIIKVIEVTTVPKSQYFVQGLINLRGVIIPVIELRKLFGIEPLGDVSHNRIIVVEVNDRTMGILVDSVSEVRKLNTAEIEAVPSTVSVIDNKYLGGVGKIGDHILILLKLDVVLNIENFMAEKDFELLQQA